MHRFARAGHAGAGWLLSIAAPGVLGCTPAPAPEPAPVARGTLVEQWVARLAPRRHALTLAPVPAAAEGGPGLSPASVDALSLVEDGTPGAGPPSTVELVTNTVGDTFAGDTCPGVAPGVPAFCGNVTLNHFFPRPLSNVFVQVTSIVDDALRPFPGHQALDGDPSALGLDSSLGLWAYTAPGAAPGVLGAAPNNGATRDWVFANPDDADTLLSIRVVASLAYTRYTRTAQSLPFVDACATGTSLGALQTSVVTLPFPFTLYDTTTSTVTVNRRGVLLAGANGLIAPAKNVALPATGNVPGCTLLNQCAVPRPAIFPFWDTLIFGGGGGLCTLTSGTAPARTFAVTWSHVQRSAVADAASDYTFTVVLHEGTDVIDLLYGQMLGPAPNAAGGAATIGVQNAAGTAATADFHVAGYGTGKSYTFTPVP